MVYHGYAKPLPRYPTKRFGVNFPATNAGPQGQLVWHVTIYSEGGRIEVLKVCLNLMTLIVKNLL